MLKRLVKDVKYIAKISRKILSGKIRTSNLSSTIDAVINYIDSIIDNLEYLKKTLHDKK